MRDPHFAARGVFARRLIAGEERIAALPVPVAGTFRAKERDVGYPELGEANDLLGTRGTP
jgi:hypothetical protein